MLQIKLNGKTAKKTGYRYEAPRGQGFPLTFRRILQPRQCEDQFGGQGGSSSSTLSNVDSNNVGASTRREAGHLLLAGMFKTLALFAWQVVEHPGLARGSRAQQQ